MDSVPVCAYQIMIRDRKHKQ